MSNYITDENKWYETIPTLNTPFEELYEDKEKAIETLSLTFLSAVKNLSKDGCGVYFSGGVDSTLIAFVLKELGVKFTCFSVGLSGSRDLEVSKEIAKELSFPQVVVELTIEEYEDVVKNVTKIIGEPDVMKVGVGSVVYAGGIKAKEMGITEMFAGLGSEELYAGYQRHGESLNDGFSKVHAECYNGLYNMWQRDIKRDLAIGNYLGLSLKVPFLDLDVIKESMKIHPKLKISDSEKKIIIRETAVKLGLPEKYAFRKKMAAQYGSKFIRGMDKITKKHGFSKKKEYLASILSMND